MGATDDRLKGKVCIVTGSSSGIGRAISLAYARQGGLLVCSDLQPEARVDVSTEREANTDSLIVQNGGRAVFVRADVRSAVDMEALVQKAVEEYGRLDV
jgi:NAD(P)-dependent dehydrogenase (short-subunit alcohol dehydrogenase family)